MPLPCPTCFHRPQGNIGGAGLHIGKLPQRRAGHFMVAVERP